MSDKKSRAKRKYENRIELHIRREDGSEQVLILYYPTSEMARCAVVYLRRCLVEKEYTIDLQYKSPDGFQSLYRDGPVKIEVSDKKFRALQDIRNNAASARMNICIFRDESYGGDLKLLMYFYSKTDMSLALTLFKLGLSSLWVSYSCDTRKGDQWYSCDEQGFCDGELATLANNLDPANRIKAVEYLTTLLEG